MIRTLENNRVTVGATLVINAFLARDYRCQVTTYRYGTLQVAITLCDRQGGWYCSL